MGLPITPTNEDSKSQRVLAPLAEEPSQKEIYFLVKDLYQAVQGLKTKVESLEIENRDLKEKLVVRVELEKVHKEQIAQFEKQVIGSADSAEEKRSLQADHLKTLVDAYLLANESLKVQETLRKNSGWLCSSIKRDSPEESDLRGKIFDLTTKMKALCLESGLPLPECIAVPAKSTALSVQKDEGPINPPDPIMEWIMRKLF